MKNHSTVQDLIAHTKRKISEIANFIDLLHENFLYASNLIDGEKTRKQIIDQLLSLDSNISSCADNNVDKKIYKIKQHSESETTLKVVSFYEE